MARTIEGRMSAEGRRFAIVAARWNEFVVKQLVDGALRAFRTHGLEDEATVVWVPGSWEIPIAVASLIAGRETLNTARVEGVLEPRPNPPPGRGREFEGVVCLGCILQGATIHATQLSNQIASALSYLTINTGVPVTWGVLTCETQEEAIERAGMKLGNKGEEAALACVELAAIREQV